MKKILLFATFVTAFGNQVFSQQDTAYPPIKYSNPNNCFYDIITYSQSGLGYITGTNSFAEKEKAQKYKSKTKVTIVGVLCRLYAASKGNNGNTYVKIYNVNYSNGQPAFLLGTSAPISMSNIKTIGYTAYSFASPVVIDDPFKKGNSDFFASVVLPTGANDSLGIFSTKMDCYSKDSLAFELTKDGLWQSMYRGWQQGTQPFSCDLIILPVISGTWTPGSPGSIGSGIEEQDFFNGIKLAQNAPNPVVNSTIVQYELEKKAGDVILEIFDVTGRLLFTVNEGQKSAGKHYIKLDAEKFPAGTYIYSLRADENRLTKQMIVGE